MSRWTEPVAAPHDVPHGFTRILHVYQSWRHCRAGHDGDMTCQRCGFCADPLIARALGFAIIGTLPTSTEGTQ